ncbi:MAG: hypothetical protein DRN66_00415 [Candidatus Nanohalarchaeota archaeon]|nr:MAG: hypothetical protein DRN66_00415 [Candidatus Nanohaloarchaeota archaeon]
MDNVLKKALMLGIGVGATTKKKLDKLIKELVKKGELSANEGKKITDDFVKKSKQHTDDIRGIINFEMKRAMKKMPFATKAELKRLEKKIDRLSKAGKATPAKRKTGRKK